MHVFVQEIFPLGLFKKRYTMVSPYTWFGLVLTIKRNNSADILLVVSVTGKTTFNYAGDLDVWIEEEIGGYSITA